MPLFYGLPAAGTNVTLFLVVPYLKKKPTDRSMIQLRYGGKKALRLVSVKQDWATIKRQTLRTTMRG